MASSFDDHLHLEQPAQGDTSWDAGINQNWAVIGEALSPDRLYFVSKSFTDANLHHASADFPHYFDTIQGAIAEGESRSLGNIGYTILVDAGVYNEQLVISKPVRISSYGQFSGGSGHFSGGRPWLRGSLSAEPVIRFTPPDGALIWASLQGLVIDNNYTGITQPPADTAYAIHCINHPTPTYGSSQNVLHLNDCALRMQTWGGDAANNGNEWEWGIRVEGWWDVNINRCDIGVLNFGGGENDGHIDKMLSAEGADASHKAIIVSRNCYFAHQIPAAHTGYTFHLEGQAQQWAHRVTSLQAQDSPPHELSENTGNAFIGIETGQETQHLNLYGISMARF
jgi:hypothetical protein